MCIRLHVKYPLFLTDFNETWTATYFRKILKYKISWKSTQQENSCCMQTDRHTGMTKLKVVLHNFANAPKIRSRKWSLRPQTPTKVAQGASLLTWGGVSLKPRPRGWLRLRFIVFLSYYRHIVGRYLKFRHDGLLSHTFWFTDHRRLPHVRSSVTGTAVW
jgi:hypothetical protein